MKNDLILAVLREKSTRDMLEILYGILQNPSITSMDKVTTCTNIIDIILEREKTESD